jgi:hypothetical protein
VTAGQDVYVDATYVSPNAQYFLENITTNQYHTYYQTTSYHDTSSAEAIFEDGTVSGSCGSSGCSVAYTSYNAMTFDDVSADDLSGVWYTINQFSVDKFRMGNTTIYMSPGSIDSLGDFTICATC